VICSGSSALLEVAGQGARLIDAGSVESIANAIKQLIEDPRLRDELAAKGSLQAAGYSWENAIAKTWAAYGELL
jgi:glycosyltransferase involved in cell wall biosynthesis